jgi:predicted 2-oxoglutarate/Fe(II)-dependent dioxygenase YbiX
MTMFPSYVLHKITPVTKGERWSLVTWIQDIKPFR